MEEYRDKLRAAGIQRDRQPRRQRVDDLDEWTDDVYIRSLYFVDPDGILLEFAAWTDHRVGRRGPRAQRRSDLSNRAELVGRAGDPTPRTAGSAR